MVQDRPAVHGSPSSYTAFSTAIWTDFDGSRVYGRRGQKLRQDRATAVRLPYGEEVSFSLFGCVQDGTGLGYTAVGVGLRSPGHAGGMGACGRVIPLGIMRLQDHGWDLSTFGLERS